MSYPMRIDRVVVNSSPLITLFNSGQPELPPAASEIAAELI
jgi:hypothetical protein